MICFRKQIEGAIECSTGVPSLLQHAAESSTLNRKVTQQAVATFVPRSESSLPSSSASGRSPVVTLPSDTLRTILLPLILMGRHVRLNMTFETQSRPESSLQVYNASRRNPVKIVEHTATLRGVDLVQKYPCREPGRVVCGTKGAMSVFVISRQY
jgi:hypothetical protein